VEIGKRPGPYCTNPEMRKWWSDYFRGNGADQVELEPLGL